MAFFYLNNALSQEEQIETYLDIEKVFEKNESFETCTFLNLKKFFKKEIKFRDFIEFFFDNPSELDVFKTHISLMPCIAAKEKLRKSPKNTSNIYEEGIDLYYKKDGNINGIAINSSDPIFMSIAMSEGSREINIKDSLLYRKHSSDGMRLADEDFEEWGNTLRRFEGYGKESDEHQHSRLNDIAKKIFPQPKRLFAMFSSYLEIGDAKKWNHYRVVDWCTVKIRLLMIR